MSFGHLGSLGAGFGRLGGGSTGVAVPYPAPQGYAWHPLTITTSDGTVHPVTLTINGTKHRAFILVGKT